MCSYEEWGRLPGDVCSPQWDADDDGRETLCDSKLENLEGVVTLKMTVVSY